MKQQGRLVIQQDVSQRYPVYVLVGFVLLALSFIIGRYWGTRTCAKAVDSIASLRFENEKFIRENDTLHKKVVRLEQMNRVSTEAEQLVQKQLSTMQQRIDELNGSLALYKRVMAPKKDIPGAQIERFSVSPAVQPNTYRFRILLVQYQRRHRLLRGQITMSILGEREGKVETLVLSAKQIAPVSATHFEFKYFKTLQGAFKLPANFSPRTVVVASQISGAKAKTMSKQFMWANHS